MNLKLIEHNCIVIFLLHKHKTWWYSDIQTFLWWNLEFRQVFTKIANFQVCHVLWRHNYVTPWLIVLILVCIDKRDQLLFIDTKAKFIGVGYENLGVRRVTKIAWLDEGKTKRE